MFGTTILENIKFGREGVTDAEVEAACMEANAWGFIQRLPKKLETMVGDKGANLKPLGQRRAPRGRGGGNTGETMQGE